MAHLQRWGRGRRRELQLRGEALGFKLTSKARSEGKANIQRILRLPQSRCHASSCSLNSIRLFFFSLSFLKNIYCHFIHIFIFFIVVQVQLSPFSPHHTPHPSHPHPPPSILTPFCFVRVSFIVVPKNPSLFPPPLLSPPSSPLVTVSLFSGIRPLSSLCTFCSRSLPVESLLQICSSQRALQSRAEQLRESFPAAFSHFKKKARV